MRSVGIQVLAFDRFRYPVVELVKYAVYGNFHISFIAFAFMQVTAILFNLTLPLSVVVCICSGAQFVYTLEHRAGGLEDASNHADRTAWHGTHGLFGDAILLGSLALMLACLPFLNARVLLGAAIISAISVGYYRPLFTRLPPLRRVNFGKPLVVAVVWAVATIAIPVAAAGAAPTGLVVTFFGYRVLVLTANLIVADANDRIGDQKAGLRTFGTTLTRNANCNLVALISLAAAIIAFFLSSMGLSLLLFCESICWIGLPILCKTVNRTVWSDLLLICPFLLMAGLS